MFKSTLYLYLFLLFPISVYSKPISIEVVAKKSEIKAETSEEQLLLLNGYRQSVTTELQNLNLDSNLFWEKVDSKKMKNSDEAEFLKVIFSNVSLAMPAGEVAKEVIGEGDLSKGTLKAEIDLDKLKAIYNEVILDLADTKFLSFYLLADIDIDSSMTWEDTGVSKAENFITSILDSWLKLFTNEFKGFEKIVVLKKDFVTKPDYMNSKSVSLKWKSSFKKVSTDPEKNTAIYELQAQFLLVSTKTNEILASFDFPIQKKEFDTLNKKTLSSNLASLVYNLLFSQTSKISSAIEAHSKTSELSEVEIKAVGGIGLSDIYQLNSLLQEKYKDLKLTARLKSFSTQGSVLVIKGESSIEKILDRLSLEGGKYPLNEQKILLFNRADKSFAILPKDSNN